MRLDLGLVGLVLIILKLTSVISWSWWLVLLPIYGPIGLGLLVLIMVTVLTILSK